MNASITTTANYITDQQYTYTPRLADLVNKVHQVAEAVCRCLNEQPTSRRLQCTSRNRNFYHLKIEADYVTHIIQGLQQANPQSSLVLLHNGLLVLPLHAAIAAVNLEHLRQMPAVPRTLGRTTTPPPTTAATLHAYFSRTTRRNGRPK